ncbi:hypothetical protein QC762_0026440 [Podospora pseudocomata]|uniref:Secreted protein n=1 Tax=Podospora pseudocomata TaxID=2093779 RepID=A0ABR0GRA1_9PEZI|nr:hypothetical protein QC762_0026440 [Podospora pseudocomata]
MAGPMMLKLFLLIPPTLLPTIVSATFTSRELKVYPVAVIETIKGTFPLHSRYFNFCLRLEFSTKDILG